MDSLLQPNKVSCWIPSLWHVNCTTWLSVICKRADFLLQRKRISHHSSCPTYAGVLSATGRCETLPRKTAKTGSQGWEGTERRQEKERTEKTERVCLLSLPQPGSACPDQPPPRPVGCASAMWSPQRDLVHTKRARISHPAPGLCSPGQNRQDNFSQQTPALRGGHEKISKVTSGLFFPQRKQGCCFSTANSSDCILPAPDPVWIFPNHFRLVLSV